MIWRCNRKFKDGQKCATPTISEETIHQLFLEAYNLLLAGRENVLADCKLIYETLADFSALDDKIRKLTEEIRFVTGMSAALIKQHASQTESDEEYKIRRAELDERYNRAQAELEKAQKERQLRVDQRKKIKRFMEMLKKQPLVQPEWDDFLWSRIAESITLHGDGNAEVCFANGVTIAVALH